MSPISVFKSRTHDPAPFPCCGTWCWGRGEGGWKVRTKQAALLVCYRKEALPLVCIKKIQHNQETRQKKKTGRGMHSPLGMQRLITLLSYRIILSQHEPSGCLCAVIIDNARMFYSESLLHLVNNQQYRKENC